MGLLQGAAVLCSALPTEHSTKPLNSEELQRRPWACFTAARVERKQLLNVTSELFFLRQVFQAVSGATHAHVSAPKSARLWHRWEHHPRGSDMRRGAPGIIQAHAAVEIQVATTPVSITMNQALCASPTEPRAPIWQPLVGGRRTGYPPDPRWGLPHPKLSFEASFCSVIAPLNW